MDIPVLDKCPGYNLYIGGFISLRRPKALKNSRISHIVSVLDWKFEDDTPLTKGYRHLHIPVDDVEDENLLEWFPRSNVFIQQGLDHWKSQNEGTFAEAAKEETEKGSGVLIHCAMGKSRSATILLAYLLWSTRQPQATLGTASSNSDMVSIPRQPLSVVQALELLRRGRGIAEPNEGFMDQLHMYEAMGCPNTETDLKHHKIYRRWMNKRSVEESLRINQAPEMNSIKFEDESESEDESDDSEGETGAIPLSLRQAKQEKKEHMAPVAPGVSAPDGTAPSGLNASSTSSSSQPQTALKCRKCRHTLATSAFILPHSPPPHPDPSRSHQSSGTAPCAHIFLHPLSWMRPILSSGQLEGRLTCPNVKCGSNIGKFAWTGLRCNCGGWITPGFGIIRGRVDEVSVAAAGTAGAKERREGTLQQDGTSSNAVRMPPGVKRGNL